MFAPHYKPKMRRRARSPSPLAPRARREFRASGDDSPPWRRKAERAMGSIANAGEDLLDELLCNKIRQKLKFNPRDTATKLTYFTNWGRKRGRRHLVMAQCLRLRLDCRRAKTRRERSEGVFDMRAIIGAVCFLLATAPAWAVCASVHLQRPGAAVGLRVSRRGRRGRRVVWSALPKEKMSVRVQARAQSKIRRPAPPLPRLFTCPR